MNATDAQTAAGRPSDAMAVLDPDRYDRQPRLHPTEREALAALLGPRPVPRDGVPAWAEEDGHLERLLRPLRDACAVVDGDERHKGGAVGVLLKSCARLDASFWGFDEQAWVRVLGPTQGAYVEFHGRPGRTDVRQYVMAIAYLLGCHRDVRSLGGFNRRSLAEKVFGEGRVTEALEEAQNVTRGWGYSGRYGNAFRGVVSEAMLAHGTSDLRSFDAETLDALRRGPGVQPARRSMLYRLSRVLAHLGVLEAPLSPESGIPEPFFREGRRLGVAREWADWVERWQETSTLSGSSRAKVRDCCLRAGRWLAERHPEVVRPEQWTRELAAEYVAVVDRMRIGEYVWREDIVRGELGKPLAARTKERQLGSMRQIFRDSQEWGWLETRFNPDRAFATPRGVKTLIGPAPRTIADDVWAKLLWAGLNLSAGDFPAHDPYPAEGLREKGAKETFYPLAMLRALAVVWLFSGLRGDEIARLRVGCAREHAGPSEDGGEERSGRVCLLEVPVNKTGSAFVKPVDPVVGEAVAAWEAARPEQPDLPDRKTGERVAFLFCCRAKRVPANYLNHSLIPVLCAKAGVPRSDARGPISVHRARSTIASQLFNAKEPMTLSELQAWLGHRSPATTQHYVAFTPTKLARAYGDAGYFERNVRAIEVLVDREAVEGGAAAGGEPWQHFDLGHGYCTYAFFEQCPHRMACARCDFYVPKGSSRAQVLEAKDNLQRMLASIPLTDEEQAAVEDGAASLDRLLERLADVPTPAGSTPRQLTGNELPVIPIRRKSAPEGDGA
jgi:integrase